MSNLASWLRVSRSNPCPICKRPDWCLVAVDGSVAICPRVESPRRAGEAGWLHRLADPAAHSRRVVRSVVLTDSRAASAGWRQLAAEFTNSLDAGRLLQLACQLGLTPNGLTALGVGWSAGH